MEGSDSSTGGHAATGGSVADAAETDGVSPEEAFSVLGNETRLAVLRALWTAPEEPVAFTDLRRRLATQTDNLDYHLDKLVGHFVRRTDRGYALQYAGEQVMRAVQAGVLTDAPVLAPREIDADCPYCGDPVELSYENEHLTARCTGCGGVTRDGFPEGTIVSYGFPPAGLEDRSPEEVLQAAHVLYDSKITPMMNGVCPECAGPVGFSVDVCEDHEVESDGLCAACDGRFEVWTEYRCRRCDYARNCAMWFRVLLEPAVIAFYYDAGALDETIPFSKLTAENAPLIENISTTVTATDPLRFRVVLPLDSAELAVRLDEDLQILDLERRDCGASADSG